MLKDIGWSVFFLLSGKRKGTEHLFMLHMMLDPSAADSHCRRQPESSGATVSRKTDGAPPSQPKLWGAAAAAEIFTARRGL